jgi:hypothetical protein
MDAPRDCARKRAFRAGEGSSSDHLTAWSAEKLLLRGKAALLEMGDEGMAGDPKRSAGSLSKSTDSTRAIDEPPSRSSADLVAMGTGASAGGVGGETPADREAEDEEADEGGDSPI